MSKKKGVIILVMICVFVILFFFVAKRLFVIETQSVTFVSQQECEDATGSSCKSVSCDYVPDGKSFEETCGKDFKKGWVAY